ncbi:hypothetical protein QJS10_CPB12g01200 [Acorus calamus]|uniref:Reverse transcriptase zinc-binding domain-containing protein n=1 Tax=Acorus calamus TaxID=4465 RepID=A0AAV9DPX8_ACOCL|nr:hypothetical protein QJS10_CPB12g01200 [Acorus calamus]
MPLKVKIFLWQSFQTVFLLKPSAQYDIRRCQWSRPKAAPGVPTSFSNKEELWRRINPEKARVANIIIPAALWVMVE